MNRSASRPSLLTRISEGQSHAVAGVDRSYHRTPRQESYVDRYRGTEFESPTRMVVVQRDHMSRGRSFVLVTGAAAICLAGTILATMG